MATVFFRRSTKKVYIYYTDPDTGKQVQVPRDQTKHLDGAPAEHVYAWADEFERSKGIVRVRSDRMNLKDTDKLAQLWAEYQKMQDNRRGKRRWSTLKSENDHWECHILPFFVKKHQRKDPKIWHDLVPDFQTHLMDEELAPASQRKYLRTLKRFGDFLVFKRYMLFPFTVLPPVGQKVTLTPLKRELSPDDVLRYCRSRKLKLHGINYGLAVLLGYFASLRTAELWAIQKEDFLTGSAAEQYTKTLSGLRDHDLGTRLSVYLKRTIGDRGIEDQMKTDSSRDIVNVWHPEAAKRIAELLKDMPKGRLFPRCRSRLDKMWAKHIQPTLGVTTHDLRRASALYLGRTVRLEPTLLQEHMRHKELSTTMLYCRQPEGRELEIKSRQDFGDIL